MSGHRVLVARGVTRWWCRDCNRLFRGYVTKKAGGPWHNMACGTPMQRVRILPFGSRAPEEMKPTQ